MLKGEPVFINGDGETSRDFCYVANAIQANVLAALSEDKARDQVYNVAVGDSTTLNELFVALRNALQNLGVDPAKKPHYRDFRLGDVLHSQADIGKAQLLLGFAATHRLREGVAKAMPWYIAQNNG
jgi:UDP-N-acetylglucosamine 4-epimerase